jgi:hypothetical protein
MNPKSGGGKAARADLGRRARDRGIDVIVLRPDDNFVALVGDAVDGGADAVGVAGGDGSLAVSRQPPLHTGFLSSAFPPARVTISRSTSASIAATCSARSTRSPTVSSGGSTWRK